MRNVAKLRRAKTFVAVIALLLGFAAAASAATLSDAETVIVDIYKQYSPDHWPTNPEEATFSPDLWQKWKEVEDAADASGDVGVDFDVFLDAQDTDTVSDIHTTFNATGNDKGAVGITFTAFGEKRTMNFLMVKTAAGWKAL